MNLQAKQIDDRILEHVSGGYNLDEIDERDRQNYRKLASVYETAMSGYLFEGTATKEEVDAAFTRLNRFHELLTLKYDHPDHLAS